MSLKIANPQEAPAPAAAVDDPVDFAGLVEQIAAYGDRAAFARLFAHYGPRVKSYLQRLGANAALAEDLTIEVMAAVWRKAANFDRRDASVTTWIFRIARNRRGDALRPQRDAMLDVGALRASVLARRARVALASRPGPRPST